MHVIKSKLYIDKGLSSAIIKLVKTVISAPKC